MPITSDVIEPPPPPGLSRPRCPSPPCLSGIICANGASPAHEPARPRRRGGGLVPALELRRDRARQPEPRHGAAAGRAARSADARAQRAAGRRPAMRRCSRERPGSPELAAVREAVEIILEGHKPYPAFALDRHWNIVASNSALPQLYDGVDPALLDAAGQRDPAVAAPERARAAHRQPRRVARPRARRLRRQIELTADPVLIELMAEAEVLQRPPARRAAAAPAGPDRDGGPVPHPARRRRCCRSSPPPWCSARRWRSASRNWRVESFFPADAETAALVVRPVGLTSDVIAPLPRPRPSFALIKPRKEPPMPTITSHDGTELFCRRWGEGPPVLFVHGWALNSEPGSSAMLQRRAPASRPSPTTAAATAAPTIPAAATTTTAWPTTSPR